MELTDWFPPSIKPVRTGFYKTEIFDAGWTYDWTVYWDDERKVWLDQPGGWVLLNQSLNWRGLKEEAK
jgi:hypothetical protein